MFFNSVKVKENMVWVESFKKIWVKGYEVEKQGRGRGIWVGRERGKSEKCIILRRDANLDLKPQANYLPSSGRGGQTYTQV